MLKLKKYRITCIFGLLAISSIMVNVVAIEYGNLILNTNIILNFLFHSANAGHFIVNQDLQNQEVNSFIIHYNWFAYVIHLASFILVGVLIDIFKNKWFSTKKSYA